jgi:D-beta-D-heptose 7-phosphate kinase/D-beta-D-heptose 1-phosphate adenosyltransferase
MYKNFRIAVMGDFMVDEWWRAESLKISPEAPVLDIINPVLIQRSAGGAGNVARNLLALGAHVDLYGIIGDDEVGNALSNELSAAGAVWKVDCVRGFETHRKIRYCADGNVLFRVSKDRCRAVPEKCGTVPVLNYHAFIISDYNKGAMTETTIMRVMRGAQEKPVFVDPKFDNISLYKGAEIIKFNKAEALAAEQRSCSGRQLPLSTLQNHEYSISVLQDRLLANNVVVTLGHAGMEVIDEEGNITDIPGREVAVSDVTGAGDTAIAVLTLEYLRSGGDIVKAAYLANYACSLVVQKRMTAVVTVEELLEELNNE